MHVYVRGVPHVASVYTVTPGRLTSVTESESESAWCKWVCLCPKLLLLPTFHQTSLPTLLSFNVLKWCKEENDATFSPAIRVSSTCHDIFIFSVHIAFPLRAWRYTVKGSKRKKEFDLTALTWYPRVFHVIAHSEHSISETQHSGEASGKQAAYYWVTSVDKSRLVATSWQVHFYITLLLLHLCI